MSVVFVVTYNTPTKKRDIIQYNVLTMKADANDMRKAKNVAYCMTFKRPQVSARNPHICDEHTMPMNGTDENKPNSAVVMCSSQFAYGSTKLALIFSIVAPTINEPHARNVIMWNSPYSSGWFGNGNFHIF